MMAGAHNVTVPANCGVTLLANFDAGEPGCHRWNLEIFEASKGALMRPALFSYGSQIGGSDIDQRVLIPAHRVESVYRITAQHKEVGGWCRDESEVEVDTPARLGLAFRWPRSASPWRLTLQFSPKA